MKYVSTQTPKVFRNLHYLRLFRFTKQVTIEQRHRFDCRLIYSFLVRYTKKIIPLSVKRLARLTGSDARTVKENLARLGNLVENLSPQKIKKIVVFKVDKEERKEEREIEGNGKRIAKFVDGAVYSRTLSAEELQQQGKHWSDFFHYIVLWRPKAESGLSWRDAAVYSCHRSFAQQGKPAPNSGIAKMLDLSRNTISRGKKELQRLGIWGAEPTADFFREKRKKDAKPIKQAKPKKRMNPTKPTNEQKPTKRGKRTKVASPENEMKPISFTSDNFNWEPQTYSPPVWRATQAELDAYSLSPIEQLRLLKRQSNESLIRS